LNGFTPVCLRSCRRASSLRLNASSQYVHPKRLTPVRAVSPGRASGTGTTCVPTPSVVRESVRRTSNGCQPWTRHGRSKSQERGGEWRHWRQKQSALGSKEWVGYTGRQCSLLKWRLGGWGLGVAWVGKDEHRLCTLHRNGDGGVSGTSIKRIAFNGRASLPSRQPTPSCGMQRHLRMQAHCTRTVPRTAGQRIVSSRDPGKRSNSAAYAHDGAGGE
jgi:hypothetical protein